MSKGLRGIFLGGQNSILIAVMDTFDKTHQTIDLKGVSFILFAKKRQS